ncbi:MAG TPA: hypothetical protein VGM17_08020 [Rhizomicrobium sp.]|jgi:hypothetical protein
MIISYLHNFIFIKTKKTAGTTVEMVLAPLCGPDDIITPLGKREEMIRGNGVPLCRNYSSDPAAEQTLRDLMMDASRNRELRRKLGEELSARIGTHTGAAGIKNRVSPDFWNKAFKFTAERHPYEKVVSLAYFTFKPSKTDAPWDEHLNTTVKRGSYGGDQYYTVDGKAVVDEFIRQERLHEDLKRVGARLQLSIPDELPRSKTKTRRDKRPAREILNEEQKAIIRNKCRLEFELLNYEP